MTTSTSVWCELAFVDGQSQPGVLIEIDDGRFRSIACGVEPGNATRLAGFTIPGLANTHSHAFHRALRSRTQTDRGSFWTWRELMYQAAARLDPDGYRRLARAVFGEMALAGISCVGEFHYIHHQPDGRPYTDPNEVGLAVLDAASAAGIRITLLDTLYLHGRLDADGYGAPQGTQVRFTDGSVGAWAERLDALSMGMGERSDGALLGAAVHSVRAVDPASMTALAEWARPSNAPVHAHASEQVAENEACLAHHGRTPVAVLADAGVLDGQFTAVHGTHLTAGDVAALASASATVALCPTTECDLGDGIGPTSEFANAGVRMALGTDSHAVIDVLQEARSLELHERLRTERRGLHGAAELLAMATVNGHRSLGWADAGTIAVGHRADLVTIRLDSVRTAGTARSSAIESSIFAASADDITDVFVDGRQIVVDGRHADFDVAAELDRSITELLGA